METVALHTVLKDEAAGEQYERLHRRIPEDVAAALAAHGVRDWRIWRDGRDVFHLVEVDDYADMRAGLRDLPVNEAWQDTVAPLFDVPDDYAPGAGTAAFVWSLARQLTT